MKSFKRLKDEYTVLLEQVNENLRKQRDYLSGRKDIGQGVVYVLQQVGTEHYKIGISSNYPTRKAIFDVKLPFEIKEIAIYETDFFRESEQEIHEKFSEYRLNNSEFFKLDEKQLSEIPDIINRVENREIHEVDEEIVNNEEHMEKIIPYGDEQLYDKAKEVILQFGQASSSFLQRKLKWGYARASRVIDMLEERGIIEKGEGSKPRKILG